MKRVRERERERGGERCYGIFTCEAYQTPNDCHQFYLLTFSLRKTWKAITVRNLKYDGILPSN